jgi:hypothetical protein
MSLCQPTRNVQVDTDRRTLVDSLYQPTDAEYTLVWRLRHYCKDYLPSMLPMIIGAVDWTNLAMVSSIYWLLENWSGLKPREALGLLSNNYEDHRVRLVCLCYYY